MFTPIHVRQLIAYQVPRESKILWANVNRNTNITVIHERWACGKSGHLAHCFVGDDGKHIELSHDMKEAWALAMVHELLITI